jgi:hypothetical protein
MPHITAARRASLRVLASPPRGWQVETVGGTWVSSSLPRSCTACRVSALHRAQRRSSRSCRQSSPPENPSRRPAPSGARTPAGSDCRAAAQLGRSATPRIGHRRPPLRVAKRSSPGCGRKRAACARQGGCGSSSAPTLLRSALDAAASSNVEMPAGLCEQVDAVLARRRLPAGITAEHLRSQQRLEAAEACPAVAISVIDDETGDTVFP